MKKIVIEINDIPKNDHERYILSHGTPIPWGYTIGLAGGFDKTLDDIKAEISSNLITHGQVIEGEYFAEDAEYINHGLNMALEIIDKHIGENTRHLKYAGEYADQDTMMPAT